jgi:hypothetical protein
MKKNARRTWEPEEDRQSVTMIAHRLKRTVTAVRRRSSLLHVSFRELKQKKSPADVNRLHGCGLFRFSPDGQ